MDSCFLALWDAWNAAFFEFFLDALLDKGIYRMHMVLMRRSFSGSALSQHGGMSVCACTWTGSTTFSRCFLILVQPTPMHTKA